MSSEPRANNGIPHGAPPTGDWSPRIVAFLCNWCSYAGADLAGVSRLQYGSNIRIVRVPCSARVDPQFIVKALQNGADGVLVSGCHPGDCHYISGNLGARRKFALIRRLLEFVGIEPQRVHFSWVSASEGGRFAALVNKVIEEVRSVGPATRLVKHLEEDPWSSSTGPDPVLQGTDTGAGDAASGARPAGRRP